MILDHFLVTGVFRPFLTRSRSFCGTARPLCAGIRPGLRARAVVHVTGSVFDHPHLENSGLRFAELLDKSCVVLSPSGTRPLLFHPAR
jgi:hypothetical protein